MLNPVAVNNLEAECQELFSKLSSLQSEIKEKMSAYSDGKNLKGNEIVGWLGEIYGKLLFDGKLVDDQKEHDFVSASGSLVSVKTRKGWASGWRKTSAIPKIEGVECPTHLLFIHLNDDYSIDLMWMFDWHKIISEDRFKKHVVRGEQRSFTFTINEAKDKDHVIYAKKP